MSRNDKSFNVAYWNLYRIVFTVYWIDSQPSTEVFYLENHPRRLDLKAISLLEDIMMEMLKSSGMNPIQSVYVCHETMSMSEVDISSVAGRVIKNSP